MGCGLKFLLLLSLAFGAVLEASTVCLTVAGLGGEPDYDQRFANWAQDLDKALKGTGSDVTTELLLGTNATKANLRAAVERIAKLAKADDAFVLMLIGHGTFDGSDYKMNLPGPDISAIELASLLDRVPSGKQLVVNATSASGGSVHALLRQNRTVITATKSGTEKNATVFIRYWIEGLRDAAADTDKNEVVTALEAFKFAELKTKQFYETNKRLATEHAALDGGDQQGAMQAGRFAVLRLGAMQKAAADPAKRALWQKREELETQIDQLKFQKAAIPTDEYKKQLSALLLELARTQAELDK